MDHEDKEIEVVSGDGSTLEVSKVYDHITSLKPKQAETKKKIVLPHEKVIQVKKDETIREKTTISGIDEIIEEGESEAANLPDEEETALELKSPVEDEEPLSVEDLEGDLAKDLTLHENEDESEDDVGDILDGLYDFEEEEDNSENIGDTDESSNIEAVDILGFDDDDSDE